MRYHLYFKLFSSIKDEHESEDLARMEIESLFGPVRVVRNFVEEAKSEPLRSALDLQFATSHGLPIRLVDILTYELPYGRIQGYCGETEVAPDFARLTRRLAYTREYVCLVENTTPDTYLQAFPESGKELTWQVSQENGTSAFRFVTHQYFLEKSEYVSKLTRNEDELLANVSSLVRYPTQGFYRIPATVSMRIGKRLEDYLALRSEPSLYLTHYMHPYKGKFHPRMARALVNYVFPEDHGIILDNFAGSGTLLVEAIMMGLNASGIEINPLSTLMTNVKCQALKIPLEELLISISDYMDRVRQACIQLRKYKAGQRFLGSNVDFQVVERLALEIPDRVLNGIKDRQKLKDMIAARLVMEQDERGPTKDFIKLLLSGAISDTYRRTSADFVDVLQSRLNNLYLRLLLFSELNKSLGISVGNGVCMTADSRNMSLLDDESVDGIVCSPPYSTALDYVRNDEAQLTILGLVKDIGELEAMMIGNPRSDPQLENLLSDLERVSQDFLPRYSVAKIRELANGGRKDAALRTMKFIQDMSASIREMFRVLKPGAKAAMVIGNNHFKVNDKVVEVDNVSTLLQIGLMQGFEKDVLVQRPLGKTSAGMIREEAIVIMRKPH